MAETLTIRTSASTDVIKVVERGPQGPVGPTGPAGGASTWNQLTGKPATFPPSAHDHQPGEVYADAAFVSQTGGSGRGGIYLRNGSDNGKPLYESPATGDYIWWDSNIDTWYLTSRTDVNLFEITNNTDDFPWETDALWQPIAPQTGNVEVDQASLFDVSDYGSTSVVGLKTPKSGNASSDELVLGSDTRLTNSRTPTAHASTHHTGGTDAIAPNNISAAWALETRAWSFFTTSTYTLAQGRNVQLNATVSANNITGTITLPRLTTDGAVNGDELSIVGVSVGINSSLVIQRYIWTGSSYIGSTETVVTGTTAGAWRFRLIDSVWTLQPVANHASTHHTGGSDPLTPANIGAAKDFTEIEVGNTGTSTTTLTTAQLPARVILFIDAATAPSATINLPTPDARQSGLVASIKVQVEGGTADTALITVVHNAVNLLSAYSLAEDEGSIDFRWDGYRWVYDANWLLRSSTGRVLELPTTSGTIARTEDFASPPAIGNTTPNSGAFTTLAANNGTLTASAPALTVGQTWNASGTTFSALVVNATNTASALGSRLLELQVNGTRRLSFDRGNSGDRIDLSTGTDDFRIVVNGSDMFRASSAGGFISAQTFALGFSNDCFLSRDGADAMAMRRPNANNPQTFRLYNTFTDASNYERGFMRWSSNVFQIGTEAGGTGSNRNLEVRVGTVGWTFATSGALTTAGNVNVPTSGNYFWQNRGRMYATADGVFVFAVNADGNFGRLCFGGTTSSFPALKRSSTTLQVRLADDSAFAPFSCGALTLNGNLDASARDIVTDTTTGTKIGTATTQKIGFFNATPVVQQAAIADATDAATTQARLNDLLATMRTFGLIAT